MTKKEFIGNRPDWSKQEHKDGVWYTSERFYKGRKMTIKMRHLHGAKIHIFDIDSVKVIKTFRFKFCTEDGLISKAQNYIDSLLNPQP